MAKILSIMILDQECISYLIHFANDTIMIIPEGLCYRFTNDIMVKKDPCSSDILSMHCTFYAFYARVSMFST